MKLQAVLVLVLSTVSFCAFCQTSCQTFDDAIDNNIKTVALTLAQDRQDRSAVQQSARLTRISNELSVLNMNLNLQIQNKCAPRKTPIAPFSYGTSAIECLLAQHEFSESAINKDDAAMAPLAAIARSKCNFKTWKTD